jgi:hypothetical protein
MEVAQILVLVRVCVIVVRKHLLICAVNRRALEWDLAAALVQQLVNLPQFHILKVLKIDTLQEFLLLLGHRCTLLLIVQSLNEFQLLSGQIYGISIIVK